jgi:hypothetical protein
MTTRRIRPEEYGNHAIWSERLGSVLAGKDGLTLWQRMTR